MNKSTSVSINAIYDLATLIINSNSTEQEPFWRNYCIHVLTHLINYLYKNLQNMSEITLIDCLDKLETSDPVELMFEINFYNSGDKMTVERWPNHEKILTQKANMAVSILTLTLKICCDKGQYSHLFE